MDDVFVALRAILARHAGAFDVSRDEAEHYALERRVAGGKPEFLAAVQVKKAYVSFHLFPVYTDPSQLDGISTALRARMQGKSCFNFKKADSELLAELDELTARVLGGVT